MASNRHDRLVDARFERDLSPEERASLEAHLVAAPEAAERYRRRHLIERVTALGPERALEEPSPMEIERIAGDLGLLEPTEARAWWRRFFALRVLGPAMVAVTAMVVLLVSTPRSELQERGASPSWSASAYAVSSTGVRPLGGEVSRSEHLKFRITRAPTDELTALSAVVVDATGRAFVVALEVPPVGDATIPGAVPLDAAAVGPAVVWLVAADDVDAEALPRDEVIARFEVTIAEAARK